MSISKQISFIYIVIKILVVSARMQRCRGKLNRLCLDPLSVSSPSALETSRRFDALHTKHILLKKELVRIL